MRSRSPGWLLVVGGALASGGCTGEATHGAVDAGSPEASVAATADAGGAAPEAASFGDARADVPEPVGPWPLGDFSLGPWPSAYAVLLRSIRSSAAALDTGKDYRQSAAQGYLLQAVAALLATARGNPLPGGEAERDMLVQIALGEIDELVLASHQVTGVGPAFGLPTDFDAFGDGSVTPAFTPFSWNSGMVALGIANLLTYLGQSGARHADVAPRAAAARAFLKAMLDVWTPSYTSFVEEGQTLGFFWYSTLPIDAKAVHNTSALIAMASEVYTQNTGEQAYSRRAMACAALLRKRAKLGSNGGLWWNYADDGYEPAPPRTRRAEDISHAAITQAFAAFAGVRRWWPAADIAAVSTTLLSTVWSGNPARMHGQIDGSSTGVTEWDATSAAATSFAVLADAPDGRPELFDFARSALVSSYFSPYERPLVNATVDATRSLALAKLFQHRPVPFRPTSSHSDSAYRTVAGPSDDVLPSRPGGLRFDALEWTAPAPVETAALTLVARTARGPGEGASVLVDLESGESRRVVLSLTYRAETDGEVRQWDGASYVTLAPLPSTTDKNGVVRWFRTSFLLDRARFDAQPSVPGTNVRLQLTGRPAVHLLEGTPIFKRTDGIPQPPMGPP